MNEIFDLIQNFGVAVACLVALAVFVNKYIDRVFDICTKYAELSSQFIVVINDLKATNIKLIEHIEELSDNITERSVSNEAGDYKN